MEKNLYFQTLSQRRNHFKNFIFVVFRTFSSLPKLCLEVFLRKDMGERYFKLSAAVTIFFILFFLPISWDKVTALYVPYRSRGTDWSEFWLHYGTWYAFLLAYAYYAFKRWTEVAHLPSVFDFRRFSRSTGRIHPLFYKLKFFDVKPSTRTIEIFCEPAVFLILGFVLKHFGQPVGSLLVFCSICYAVSNASVYKDGDDFVMDLIDETIMNEELENAFVNDMPPDKTRGVRYMMRKPTAKDLREKIADNIIENDDEDSGAVVS